MFSKFQQLWSNKLQLTSQQVAEAFDRNLENLNEKIASNSGKIGRQETKLQKISKELYGHENVTTKRFYGGSILLILILGVVATLEISTNSLGLEMFKRTQTVTTAMAIAFGGLMAFSAHKNGYFLKRSQIDRKNKQSSNAAAWGFWILIIAAALFWFMATFRVSQLIKLGYLEGGGNTDWAQAGFSMGIYLVGVVASYFHTSSAKDVELEKVFKRELQVLRDLNRNARKLQKEKDRLLKRYTRDHARAKDWDAKEATRKSTAANNAEIENHRKDTEAKDKLETEFRELKEKFDDDFAEAKVIDDRIVDKTELKSHQDFIRLVSRMESFIEDMEPLASDVENGEQILDTVKESFNTLNK